MGRLIIVKCDCGFCKDDYMYGVNSAYPEELVFCPKCGNTVIASLCGFTD
jgi:hypothetical protein